MRECTRLRKLARRNKDKDGDLSEDKIKQLREKLNDKNYMDNAISNIADDFERQLKENELWML